MLFVLPEQCVLSLLIQCTPVNFKDALLTTAVRPEKVGIHSPVRFAVYFLVASVGIVLLE